MQQEAWQGAMRWHNAHYIDFLSKKESLIEAKKASNESSTKSIMLLLFQARGPSKFGVWSILLVFSLPYPIRDITMLHLEEIKWNLWLYFSILMLDKCHPWQWVMKKTRCITYQLITLTKRWYFNRKYDGELWKRHTGYYVYLSLQQMGINL